MLTSPRGRVAALLDPALKRPTIVAAALVYVQIVFGALVAHAGPLDLHLAGAVVVFAFVPIVTVRLRRTTDPVAAPAATLLLALLGVQLVLGAGLLVARSSSVLVFGGQVTAVLLPVVHRLVGSLVLGAAVVLAVRASTAATHAVALRASGTVARADGLKKRIEIDSVPISKSCFSGIHLIADRCLKGLLAVDHLKVHPTLPVDLPSTRYRS